MKQKSKAHKSFSALASIASGWESDVVLSILDDLAALFCDLTTSNFSTCLPLYHALKAYTDHTEEVVRSVANGYLMRLYGGFYANSTLLIFLNSQQAYEISRKYKTWWEEQWFLLYEDYWAKDQEANLSRKRRRLSENASNFVHVRQGTNTSSSSSSSSAAVQQARNPSKQILAEERKLFLYLNYFLAYSDQLHAERYEFRHMENYVSILYHYLQLYEEGAGYAPAAMDLASVLECNMFVYPENKDPGDEEANGKVSAAHVTSIPESTTNEEAEGTTTNPVVEDLIEGNQEESNPQTNNANEEEEQDIYDSDQFEHALEILEVLANKRYSPALYHLGILIGRGKVRLQNFTHSQLLRQAAELQFDDAKSRYGIVRVVDQSAEQEHEDLSNLFVRSEDACIPKYWGLMNRADGGADLRRHLDVIYQKEASFLYSTVGLLEEPYLIGLARRAGVRYISMECLDALRMQMEYQLDQHSKWLLHALIESNTLSLTAQNLNDNNNAKVISVDESHVQTAAGHLEFEFRLFKDSLMQSTDVTGQIAQDCNEVENSTSLYKKYLQHNNNPSEMENDDCMGKLIPKSQFLQEASLWRTFTLALKHVQYRETRLFTTMHSLYHLTSVERAHVKPFDFTTTSTSSFSYLIYTLFTKFDEHLFRYITSFLGYQHNGISMYDSVVLFPWSMMKHDFQAIPLSLADISKDNHTDGMLSCGMHLLHIQVIRNAKEEVLYLLDEMHIDVDIRTPSERPITLSSNTLYGANFTALHFAVANGNLEMVKLLLEKGADIYAVTNGCTCSNGPFEDCDSREYYQESPLKLAIRAGHVNVVEFLIDELELTWMDIVSRVPEDLIVPSTVVPSSAIETDTVKPFSRVCYIPNTLLNIALFYGRIGVVHTLLTRYHVMLHSVLYYHVQFEAVHELGESEPTQEEKEQFLKPCSAAKFLLDHMMERSDIQGFLYRHVQYLQSDFLHRIVGNDHVGDDMWDECFGDTQLDHESNARNSSYDPNLFLNTYFCNTENTEQDVNPMEKKLQNLPQEDITSLPKTLDGGTTDRFYFMTVIETWTTAFLSSSDTVKRILHEHEGEKHDKSIADVNRLLTVTKEAQCVLHDAIIFSLDKLVRYMDHILADNCNRVEEEEGRSSGWIHQPQNLLQALKSSSADLFNDEDKPNYELNDIVLESSIIHSKFWNMHGAQWYDGIIHYLLHQTSAKWCQDTTFRSVIQSLSEREIGTGSTSKSRKASKHSTESIIEEVLQVLAQELALWLHYICIAISFYDQEVCFCLQSKLLNFFFDQAFLYPSSVYLYEIDDEDYIVEQAYYQRQQEENSYKFDSFEMQRYVRQYDGPCNPHRFIVTNAKREVDFYRSQRSQLVIARPEFSTIFQACLERQVRQLFPPSPSSSETPNQSGIVVHISPKAMHLLQLLFEQSICRLLNKINNVYITPWILVAFRLFPQTYRYVAHYPMTPDQRVELQQMYSMLPLQTLQQQYDVEGCLQDLSSVHIIRMAFSMELHENTS